MSTGSTQVAVPLPPPPFFAVVRRGDSKTSQLLRERYNRRDLIDIRWDRRRGERRTIAQEILPERRSGGDRRRPLPEMWQALGFILVPAPVGPGALIPGSGPGGPAPGPVAEAPRSSNGRGAGAVAAALPGIRPREAGATAVRRVAAASSAGVVALVQANALILPSFFDTATGWRCSHCDSVLVAPAPGHEVPRDGDACPMCHAEVVRVLRWGWQRVNWLGLALLLGAAYLAGRLILLAAGRWL